MAKGIRVVLMFVISAGLICVTACAPRGHVGGVQAFRQAFNNVQSAGQPLLDDLAAAEREIAIRDAEGDAQAERSADRPEPMVLAPEARAGQTKSATDIREAASLQAIIVMPCYEGYPRWQTAGRDELGYIDGFCIEDAPLYVERSEPPGTAGIRYGVEALDRYSLVLVTLAEGGNIETARAQLASLGVVLTGALALLPGTQGPAAIITPVLGAMGPLIDEAGKYHNYNEIVRLATEAQPGFVRLIAALKAATPMMFKTLTRSLTKQIQNEPVLSHEEARRIVGQVEAYRRALSLFVVLLDDMAGAHADLIAAINENRETPLTVADTIDRLGRLNDNARAIREVYILLRRRM